MDIHQVHQRMYTMKKNLTSYFEMLSGIRQSLALSTSENLFKYYLADVLQNYEIAGYSICINQDIYYDTKTFEVNWKGGFCDKQYVMTGMRNKERCDDAQVISTSELYPSYLEFDDEKCHVYLFHPIQKIGVGYGYLVVADGISLLEKKFALNLTGAINNAYANLRNLLNLEKLNKWLDSVYTVDAMTGLYNRFGYMREGFEMYEKCKVQGKALIVMFMDMDRLKMINDTFGHSAGDEALIAYSKLLKRCAGDDKIAIRYGGDEFIIIGPMESQNAAEDYKKYILEETRIVNEERAPEYEPESSSGDILTEPKTDKELDDYVKEADHIMYTEKQKRKKARTE